MKKILLTLTVLCISTFAFAQWTTSGSDIYFNGGKVRIDNAFELTSGLNSYLTSSSSGFIYRTNGGGTGYPFSSSGNMIFQTRSNDAKDFIFAAGTTPAAIMAIKNNGTVGIGTTSPVSPLHIESSTNKTLSLDFTNANSNDTYTWKSLLTNSVEQWRMVGRDDDDANLEFWSKTGSKFTLTQSGNVGIGTTSPSNKLSIGINDNNTSTAVNAVLNVFNENTTVNNTASIAFGQVGTTSNSFARIGAIYEDRTQNTEDQHLFFSTIGAGSYAERMRITSIGNVGIGTTSPGSELDVIGEIRSAARITSNSTSSQMPQLYLRNSGSLMSGQKFGYIFSNMDGIMLQANTTGIDANTANGHMVIRSSGNVGIGTTSPTEKLEVNGTIRTKKVKVSATGWPDYVFSENYKLRTLNELEEYIKANKHLPEVPPATAIEANGLDLGSMDATLLKKVEELTLYMIELNRTVQAQGERIKELEKENETLKSQKK